MKIEYAGLTFQGPVRRKNEDNFYINGEFMERIHTDSPLLSGSLDPGKACFAVFDGLGGENEGDAASYIAASHIGNHSLLEINRMICGYTREKGLRFCGTTAAVIDIDGDKVSASNVGDSRIYLLENGEMTRISKDHAKEWNKRRYITQSLGISSFVIEPYIVDFALKPGSVILLCSDGLTDMLNEKEIRSMLDQNPGQAVFELKKAVLKKGAVDNTTIVVIKCI